MDAGSPDRVDPFFRIHALGIIQLIHDQAAHRSAAVVPHDQHVMVRRALLTAVLDKGSQGLSAAHRSQRLFIHKLQPCKRACKALQLVRGDLDSQVIAVPLLRTARLHDQIHLFVGICLQDLPEIVCRAAAVSLKIRAVQIEHDRPGIPLRSLCSRGRCCLSCPASRLCVFACCRLVSAGPRIRGIAGRLRRRSGLSRGSGLGRCRVRSLSSAGGEKHRRRQQNRYCLHSCFSHSTVLPFSLFIPSVIAFFR